LCLVIASNHLGNGPAKAEQRETDLLEGPGTRGRTTEQSGALEETTVAALVGGARRPADGPAQPHPALSAITLMRLQRSAGNAALASLLERPQVQRLPDADAGTAVAEPPQTAAKDQSPVAAAAAPPPPPVGATPNAGSQTPGPVPSPPVSSAAPPVPIPATASQSPDGAGPLRPPPAPLLPEVSGPAAAVFASFAASMADVRSSMVQAADNTTQRVRAAADLQKQNLQAAAVSDAGRVDDVYTNAIKQVKQSFIDAQQKVLAERDAQIGAVRGDADKHFADLGKGVEEQRTALTTAAGEKGQAATQSGEDHAARALSESRVMGITAVEIGARKAAEWQTHARGSEIARMASEMASALAKELGDNGNGMATQTRKDASSLAAKFQKESGDSSLKFTQARMNGEAKITETRDAAVQKIGDLAKDPIVQLQKQASDLVDQLEAQRSDAAKQLPIVAQAGAASVERAATEAIGNVNAKATESVGALDDAVTKVAAKVDGVSKHQAKSALDRAAAGIAAQVTDYNGQLVAFGQQTEKSLEAGTADAAGKISAQAGTMISPVQEAAAGFTSTADKTSGTVSDDMGKVSGGATTDMSAAVEKTTGEVAKAVTASRAQWDQDLTAGIGEIKGKVDNGLGKGRTELEGLAAKIDTRGHEIESESWLTRAWHFTEGLFVGFFKSLGELLLVLLIVAIAVVVLAVVVLVVAALIGGLGGVLAVIGAVAAVIGAIAGIVAFLAVVVAAAIVIMAIVKVVKALTQDNLTDFERGSLWGSAVFDVVTIIFGAKIVKWLATWIESLRDAEEIAQLNELRGLVKDEELLQRLLKLTNNDTAQLKALLEILNNDGSVAEKLLIATGSDAGKAARLAKAAGSPARVSELLDLADDNPDRILELLDRNGGDAEKVLEDLRQAKAPEAPAKPEVTVPEDPERLAKMVEIRKQYLDGIKNMDRIEAELRAAGKTTEEIARRLSAERNSLKVMTRALMKPEEVAQLEARNLKSWYHDPVGPTPDQLFERYGSWEKVIQKAKETDHALNRLLGLE